MVIATNQADRRHHHHHRCLSGDETVIRRGGEGDGMGWNGMGTLAGGKKNWFSATEFTPLL